MKNFVLKAACLSIVGVSLWTTSTQAAIVRANASGQAYRVEGVTVGAATYNVDFEHGTYSDVYGVGATTEYSDGAAIGGAILAALFNPAQVMLDGGGVAPPNISQLVDKLVSGAFGSDIKPNFYLPVDLFNYNNTDHLTATCQLGMSMCNYTPQSPNGQVMYALLSPGGSGSSLQADKKEEPTIPGDVPSAPTPAMIPGLIGMGWATLRKKQRQAA